MVTSYLPTVIETTARGERQFDLPSRLLKDRIILLNGVVSDVTSYAMTMQLLYLDSVKTEDITIYINSPGGSVSSGLAIYDTMKSLKSDVRTIAMGMAASMGAFLLAAGTKGKRISLPSTRIMIHQPSGGAGRGMATDVQIAVNEMLYLKKYLTEKMADSTGQSYEKCLADMERDNYMSAEEAKAYGLIDMIEEKIPE